MIWLSLRLLNTIPSKYMIGYIVSNGRFCHSFTAGRILSVIAVPLGIGVWFFEDFFRQARRRTPPYSRKARTTTKHGGKKTEKTTVNVKWICYILDISVWGISAP